MNLSKLLKKDVLVLKGIGSHFHIDVLCPMVQDPQSDKSYTLETIDSIREDLVMIRGRWYHPCPCVDRRFRNK